ncbi:MAG: DNA translocase FtsK [Planctomycetota bacterium]
MPRSQAETETTPNPYLGILWAAAAAMTFLVSAALISHDPLDAPNPAVGIPNTSPSNWVGKVGATFAHHAYLMLGPGVWVLITAVTIVLLTTASRKRIEQPLLTGVGVVLMALAVSTGWSVYQSRFATDPLLLAPWGPGGLIAVYFDSVLSPRFGLLGTFVLVGVTGWVGAVLAMDRVALAVPRAIGAAILRALNIQALPQLKAKLQRLGVPEPIARVCRWMAKPFLKSDPSEWDGAEDDLSEGTPLSPAERRKRKLKRGKLAEPQAETIDEDAGGFAGTEAIEATDDDEYEWEYEDEDGEAAEYEEEDEAAADAPAAYVSSKKKFDPDDLRKKIAQMPINFAARPEAKELPRQEVDLSGYAFPTMELLEEPEGDFNEEMAQIVRDQAVELESAMKQYKIDGEVVGIDSGPVITLFEVRLAPGTKVAKLSAVDSDLARALMAPNIRVVANMAGKNTVGVEVPNVKKERVRMKELMSVAHDKASKMKLPMFLGKDASGTPLVHDLNAMPHMLIAGTTGSGKSVCMNSIIMSFLFTKRPDELKLVLVDPKMVEMSQFKSIPHLMCPVVTEMSKAAAILEWAVTKMDERYELLAEVGVRDIASYNELGWDEIKDRMEPGSEEEAARIPKKLPYMVFIIDELADLMMTNKEVEGYIVRIAQKARAVGIHLILATQRPSANVVTGLIKSNMPCRIAMKVASGMDSRIVLDQKGGELLLGHGDMLFLSPRSSELIRAQGTLVDDAEIRKSVKFLRDVSQQSFEPQLVQMRGDGVEALEHDRDPLFDQAVEILIETGRGSVSLLQRKLTIGYARASRIIEMLEQYGVLGGHKTAQAREVLITTEEWEAMKAQAAADAGVTVHGEGEVIAPGSEQTDTEADEYSEDNPDAEEALEYEDAEEAETDDDVEYEYEEYEEDTEEEDEDDRVPAEFADEYRN